jgi:hypothetical protein
VSGAIGQSSPGVPGGVWGTNAQGISSPQAGRPALSGGLQQMQMLQAFRQGAGMQQLQAMNPYTPRPTQFLPQALPNFDYAGQYRQQQAKPAQALGGYYGGNASDSPIGADGLGDGSAAAAASAAAGDTVGGSLGEAIGDAIGGGGDGGGGSK